MPVDYPKYIILLVFLLACSNQLCMAKKLDADSLVRSYKQNQPSEVEQVNAFTIRNFNQPTPKMVTLTDATVVVTTRTPINSSVAQPGDPVCAEVVSSSRLDGSPWLPVGTVLKGCVEQVKDATYGRTDGKIYLRFYKADVDGHSYDISTSPDSSDTAIHPQETSLSKKAMVKNTLMAASFIAVPLALGTGGVSLAITTGAGAIIGGALAEPGQHIKGAVDGAWQGSGLGMLNPIVKKGRLVALPTGTKLSLALREPIRLPQTVVTKAVSEQQPVAVQLQTAARVVSKKPVDVAKLTANCELLLSQHDLASALGLLDKALASAPDNTQLVEMRQRLIDQASLETAAGGAAQN